MGAEVYELVIVGAVKERENKMVTRSQVSSPVTVNNTRATGGVHSRVQPLTSGPPRKVHST